MGLGESCTEEPRTSKGASLSSSNRASRRSFVDNDEESPDEESDDEESELSLTLRCLDILVFCSNYRLKHRGNIG